MVDDTETEKYEFHQRKSPISINNTSIKKTSNAVDFNILYLI